MRKLGWVILAIAVAGFIACGVNSWASGQGEQNSSGQRYQQQQPQIEIVFSSPGSTNRYYYCDRYEFDEQKNTYTLYKNDRLILTAKVAVGWTVFIGLSPYSR